MFLVISGSNLAVLLYGIEQGIAVHWQVASLIRFGADLFVVDHDGRSALHYAAGEGKVNEAFSNHALPALGNRSKKSTFSKIEWREWRGDETGVRAGQGGD